MNQRLSKTLRTLASVFMIGAFAIFAFGQASSAGDQGDPDPVRVIGWIGIIIAALTHTAMNVYNMVRGKNYEQLKEAMANYKELAESRKAQVIELEARNQRLENENEILAEKVLRK